MSKFESFAKIQIGPELFNQARGSDLESTEVKTLSPDDMTDTTQTRSRRACSDPVGNGIPGNPSNQSDKDGCNVCGNQGKYGYGSSVCGRCNRCHGCGSSNNGTGPLQAIYFGGKKVVKKITSSGEKREDPEKAGESTK